MKKRMGLFFASFLAVALIGGAICQKDVRASEVVDGVLIIDEGTTEIASGEYRDRTDITKVVIPDGVTDIRANAFNGCINLEEVVIPDSVETIYSYAFYGCTGLKRLTMPYPMEYNTSDSGASFAGCTSIEYVKIVGEGPIDDMNSYNTSLGYYKNTPWNISEAETLTVELDERINRIGAYMFCDCENLVSVSLNDNMVKIGKMAFANCTSLEGTINLPGKLRIFGDSAFANCTGITKVTIISNMSTLPSNVFSGCTGITSIVLSPRATTIASGAFADCDSISDVYYTGTAAEWAQVDIDANNGSLADSDLHTLSSAKVATSSLDVREKIGVNFFLNLPDEFLADEGAYIMVNGKKYDIPTVDDKGRYPIRYYIAGAEQRDDIVVSCFLGDGSKYPILDKAGEDVTATGFIYTGATFTEEARSSGRASDELLTMLDRMNDYGLYAQMFFDHNSDIGSFSGIAEDVGTVSLMTLDRFTPVITTAEGSGIRRSGSTLNLESAITLNHNFKISEGTVDDYIFTVDGKEITTSSKGSVTLSRVGDKYRISIFNIAPAELHITHEVVVTNLDGDELIRIDNYSPLSYAQTVVSNYGESPADAYSYALVRMLQALYLFNRAAVINFGIEDDYVPAPVPVRFAADDDTVNVVFVDGEEDAEVTEAEEAEEPAGETEETEATEVEVPVEDEPVTEEPVTEEILTEEPLTEETLADEAA